MPSLRSTTQLPRHAPPSLSLGSLGDFAHLIRAMSVLEDIPSPMPPTKLHGFKTSSSESIASPMVGPSVASRLFRSRRFQSSQASAAREFDSTFARRQSRGGHVHTLHAQQLRASRQRGGFWLCSIACASPSPSFHTFTLGHPSRVRASLPELFSGVCPNPMKSPNHALQRTAPRVTVAAILAWTRPVRAWRCPTSVASLCAPPSQLPRHAPPSLSLGS